ncbi:MAG TPA: WD40 repeat domain-containing protein, partial [Pirellulaceae bacterium]|nr:WD40 repeat domain-containing protein [Pirellulaceae bacterium]
RGDESSAPEHGRISQFELSGDGRHVLISMIGNRQRGRLAMWNHGQERLVYSKDFNSARGDFTRLSQWGISPDGQRVATIRQNHLELLDAWTATLVNRIAIHRIGSDGLTWCCKNPNHVLVVDNTDVLFADLQADEVRHVTRLDPGRHGILSNLFCVSRDGTRMLIVDSRLRDPRAIVIDLEAGEIVVDRPLELQQIFGAAISPNGKTAAFGLGDGRILIWELEQLSRSLRNP